MAWQIIKKIFISLEFFIHKAIKELEKNFFKTP